jgi:ubiquinone/menaquinone biosynthesis C-methylase UbiE
MPPIHGPTRRPQQPLLPAARWPSFAGHDNARFESNNGRSLPVVADSSMDLTFSFDSLVHIEAEVLAAYLRELARVHKPDGVAFRVSNFSITT